MSDSVMVRPARTYLEGSALVTPESEPYPVSRSRAVELRSNGLVTWEEPEAIASAPDPEPDPAASKPAGRRSRAS